MRFLALAFLLAGGLGVPAYAQTPTLTPAAVPQGGLGRVVLPVTVGRQVTRARLMFDGVTVPCRVDGENVVGLFAVNARTPVGKGTATLVVEYEGGETERFPVAVPIRGVAFPTQRISNMPGSKSHLMSDEVLAKERKILYGAMERTAPEPLWEGVFSNPLEGRISSAFGRKRYVNGKFWGQHSGRDVAAPTGKPVRAPNTGRVLVAQKLWMRGNTVMLDHGMGVFSLYNHLSRIDVKEGQEIRKGETLGLVGTTGFSTGPHLHWEMRVGRTPFDPAGPLRGGIPLP